MGSQNFVYGYIEVDPNFHEQNCEILKKWQFDKIYPFTNIFSNPISGYQSSIISFAGIYKSIREDFDEWEMKFKELLSTLYAYNAKIHLEDELDGELLTIDFICEDGWNRSIAPLKRKWLKSFVVARQNKETDKIAE